MPWSSGRRHQQDGSHHRAGVGAPGADMGRRLTRREVMAEASTADLGKGKRITGGDRSSLAGDLRKRYDGGESIRSLAESTNRSYGFVHRLLSESGATLRSRGGANRNSKKKV
jgi:hypothetical protein